MIEVTMSNPNPPRIIRVALVDEHPIIRAGLHSVLTVEAGVELLGETSDLEQALEVIEDRDVHVVILGVRDPIGPGLQALRRLKESRPEVAPIVFTDCRTEVFLLEALLAGARGYLMCDDVKDEIVDVVRIAGRGKSTQVPGELLVQVLSGIPCSSNGHSTHGPLSRPALARLTERELEILNQMATGETYRTIADRLFLAESTVKKYAHSVITKLGASNRSTAVLAAYRLNLLQEDEPGPQRQTSPERA
jgi:DNA-binding NarL/FixJ family response regulator